MTNSELSKIYDINKRDIFYELLSGSDNLTNDKESSKVEDGKGKILDRVSDALALASFIPGADTVTNLLSIFVDLARGDYKSAGLDALGMLPVVGEGADALKVAGKAASFTDMLKLAGTTAGAVKFVDKSADAAKAADKMVDAARAVDKTADTAKTVEKTLDYNKIDEVAEFAEKVNGNETIIKITEKSLALKNIDKLPPDIRRNAKSFFKRSSNNYNMYSVVKNKNGTYTIRMENPGKVPGSKAVYNKVVDNKGNTIKVYKDTFDPKGNLVHRKDK